MRRWLKYVVVLLHVGFAISFILLAPVVPFQMSVYHSGGACPFPHICSWLPGYTYFDVMGSISFYLFKVGGEIGYPGVAQYQFNWSPVINRT